MMKVQILGTGCPRCRQLADNVVAAAAALGAEIELQKVTSLPDIARMGVMFTPALAVDGVVKSSGRVLDVEAIKALLR